MTEHADWPALPYADWAPTKKTLHMVAQMLGKVKLALAPPQPQWFHVRLFMDPRGFATGPIPHGARTVSLGIDVFHGAVWLAASDGRSASVPLAPDRTVADVWADFGGRSATWASSSTSGRSPRSSPTSRRSQRTPTTAPSWPRTRSATTGCFRR